MDIARVPLGQPLPPDVHNSMNELIYSWCNTMHIEPPVVEEEDDD